MTDPRQDERKILEIDVWTISVQANSRVRAEKAKRNIGSLEMQMVQQSLSGYAEIRRILFDVAAR